MPDATTPASTTPAGKDGGSAAPDVAALERRATEAEAAAAAHAKDADQSKRYLVELVSRLQSNASTPAQAAEPEMPPATREELIEEFKADPVGLMDRHFAARMGPILQDHLTTQAMQNRNASIDRNKDDWSDFGKEVDAFMEPMSASTKAKPGSWDEAMRYIKAKHMDEIVEKRVKQKLEDEKKGLLEGRGVTVDSTGRKLGRLTEMEKSVAKGFGMTDEDWLKHKTAIEKGETAEDF